MAFPDVSDIAATTIERRSPKIADNVLNNDALFFQLNEKGRVKPLDGGRLIYEPLSFAANTNGGWYSGYDTLPTGAADVISAAEFSWKQYACPVVVSGLEDMQNSGEEQVINLVAARVDVAESTVKNDLSTGLYSDGTGSGGKQIVGLDAAIAAAPSTGTYGGIDRATWTFWRNQTQTVSSTASTIQVDMTNLWLKCIRGKDKPTLIMSGSTRFGTFMASLQAIQRVSDSKMADAGFENVTFMGTPVVPDGGIGGAAGATNMYFINSNYLMLRPHSRRNFVSLNPEKRWSYNQDATVQILAWGGALTCSGAQFQGRGIFA